MKTLEQTFHELTALISDQTRDLAIAMAELASVAQQRDKHAQTIAAFVDADDAKERDTARQSLRAAEADLAEVEADNSDLRGINKRLVADLAVAMERLAESAIDHFLGAE
jgi:hypothetical protein